MNYSLALELKNAGFPQTQPHCSYMDNHDCTNPTLSELIEACGDSAIFRFRLQKVSGTWVADNKKGKEEEFGSTPEEAVARLWLALNKKP